MYFKGMYLLGEGIQQDKAKANQRPRPEGTEYDVDINLSSRRNSR